MSASVFHSTFMHHAPERGEFAPPQPPGMLRAFGLALLAHALLLGALTWGVHWKREADTSLAVEAELWSAVPQQAAPRQVEAPPPPPPAPAQATPAAPQRPAMPEQRDADIALARQKKDIEKQEAEQRELEKQRLAQEKRQRDNLRKMAEEKKKLELKQLQEAQRKEAQKLQARQQEAARKEAADSAKALEAQRQANLRRMTGMAGATGSETATGNAQRSSGPSASYGSKVVARIKPNIVFTDDIAGNPTAEVEVRTAPDGAIVSRRLTKSSGNKAWDDAVIKAIDKTETLPRDVDGRVPSALSITFRPKD
jgi:colicin import membrane protein